MRGVAYFEISIRNSNKTISRIDFYVVLLRIGKMYADILTFESFVYNRRDGYSHNEWIFIGF